MLGGKAGSVDAGATNLRQNVSRVPTCKRSCCPAADDDVAEALMFEIITITITQHAEYLITVTSTQTDNLHERLISENQKHLDPLARFNYALFLHLKEFYNFTFSVQATRSWGYKTKAGRFDGMMGVIQRNEADIGASSALIKKERLEIVDYAGHTWKFWPRFLFLHPSGQRLHTALLTPLSTKVWFCAILAGLMITLILNTSSYVHADNFCNLDGSWSSTLITTIGTFTLQGAGSSWSQISWRITLLTALLLASLLNIHYGAAVVGSLLIPAPHTIRTLQDLMESPLRVAFENVSYNREYVARTTDKLGRELIHRKKPEFVQLSEGVIKIRKGFFAFHTEGGSVFRLAAMTFTESQKCALSDVSLFTPAVMSMPVKKKSPLRELFARGWSTRRPNCDFLRQSLPMDGPMVEVKKIDSTNPWLKL
uniref:Ionotropic receptor 26 n=1 Tax=Locusta migratoria TaxID=7004 RepID=A0A0M4JB31_LOCMI|nr:ionotropic receptor 26 [Locusta migratoria]